MVERISALEGHVTPRHIGEPGRHGIGLELVTDLVMHQVAAWPDTLDLTGRLAARAVGAERAPGPGHAVTGSAGSLLRIEPLKWWTIGVAAPTLASGDGAVLDLSHSRTRVRITGDDAALLLQRHLPLDCRESGLAVNAVASSAIHHVGVTVWHSEDGYELFLPRGFALSLWELLLQSAEQFGADINTVGE